MTAAAQARTLMVMAGGTGGHIMPGLAVAGALRARGWNVVWMGNPLGMEARLVPQHGIPLAPVGFSGVRGKGALTLLKTPFALLRAARQARSALRSHRPQVVLGMGGYVALPGGLMARLSGIPLVVHEQNSVPGMTNRVLARIASKVLTAFPNALEGEVTGNPVRPEVLAVPAPEQRFAGRSGALRVLVVGGSLGAQALNSTVPQALAKLPADRRPVVMHQAGEKHLEQLKAAYAAAGVEADCRAFIADMAAAYAEADLVICRSGAMTVAEVAAAGVAALFVPFPFAVDDHQTTNAKYLSDAQAGWLKPQSELNADWLAEWLAQRNRPELAATATRARALAHPLATERIADICEAAARR
jgi:UDP-N-acetylglucosamine--N-acetylmuramyl-(pentapeptide) pyrophosphoryl-undecaprenol N-acetylglucosamine transferase